MDEPDVDTAAAALSYIESWLGFRRGYLRIPGVQAAVLQDSALVLSRAYGWADVEAGVALTTDHLFRVASHSKTFTATAILQLAEAGRLRLDDPVGRWLPFLEVEPGAAIASVTLRELLAHGGGLVRDGHDADFWQLLAPFPDRAQLEAVAVDSADIQPPNVRFKYSNIAYGLLGQVIEAATGTTYHDHVAREVVQRLGLTNTGPELDPARAGDLAVGYSSLAYAAERVRIEHVDTRALASATGFYSTADDLAHFAAAHFLGDERLLSDRSKRVAQRDVWQVEGIANNAYGLGFGVVRVGGRRLPGHAGGYPGHITRTVFDPDTRLAVSVLTNAIDGPAEPLALGIVKLLDLAARLEPDPFVQSRGADRFVVRLANLWGVRDVALLGGRLVVLDPTAPDPTEGFSELAVEGESTLRVTRGSGYHAVGESAEYVFGSDGRVETVRGPGGLTWWPLETYRPR